MLEDKWQEIKDKIGNDFEVLEHETESLEDVANGPTSAKAPAGGEVEILIFNSPLGKMKVTRTKKPKVLDKKTFYSNRAGGAVNVEYEYSETETVDNVEVFKWDDFSDNWKKADLSF